MGTEFRTCAVGLTLALIASTAPATAEEPPSPGQPTQQPAEQVAAKMNQAEPVTISVFSEEPARAGGLGQVRIPIVRRSDSGPGMRNVQTRVKAPSGTKLTTVTGKRWRCTVTGRTALCSARQITPDANPAPIFATFSVKKSYKKPKVRIDARARWAAAKKWRIADSGTVEVKRPLSVTLKSASGRVIALSTLGAPVNRQFILQAEIGNIHGAQVAALWQQLSGPKVRMLDPVRVHNAQAHLGQTMQLPKGTRKDATMRFRLQVRANGQQVARTVTVRTLAHRQAMTSKGRDQRFVKLAKASNQPVTLKGRAQPTGNGLRLTAKHWTVRPGAATTVRIRTKRNVAGITWSVDGKPAGTGRSIRVSAPAVPRTSTLVAATVTLRNGAVLQESGQVSARGPRISLADDPSPENIAALCQIAADAKKKLPLNLTIKLAGGVTLEAAKANIEPDKDFFKGTTCVGKSTLKISKATLTHPSGTFLNVSAELTATDGMKITAAGWKLPQALTVGKIDSVSLIPADLPAGARLEKGQWKLMEGELAIAPFQVGPVKVNGLSLIPMADGWKFAEGNSVVTFLNSSPEHPEIKDGTLQLAEKVVGPDDLSIQLSANSANGSWNQLQLTASNIGLGATADGDTLMAAGTGTLALGSKGSSVELEISCVKDGEAVATCELLKGLILKDFKLVLSREKIGLAGEGGIKYGDPSAVHEFGLLGAYNSSKNWSLAVTSSDSWPLVDGMTLTKLAGNLGMTPIPNAPTTSRLTAGLTGTLTGLDITKSVKVNSLTPTITNACPPDTPDCNTGDIRFSIAANVTATLPGNKTVPLTAGALLNLTTMEFAFDFGAKGIAIGPRDLQVTDAQFVLTNAKANGSCRAHNAPDGTALDIGFAAQATLLSATVTVGGNFDAAGYCLWGRPGDMEVGPAMSTSDGVLSFTNYPNGADLKLPNQPTKLIGGNQIRVNGQFDLPQAIDTTFGIPKGALEYEATYDFNQKGVHFALSYTPTKGISIYKGNGSEMTLTKVGFTVNYSAASKVADLGLFANGNLFVAGSNEVPDSNTPMGVKIGFTISPGKVEAKLQAGLLTDAGPIQNAFGQQGLTVRVLSVAVGFTLPAAAPELSFYGDVSLPDRWFSSVAIKNNARVALAFRLATEKPCIKIEIGEEETTKRNTVVDIANKGFLTAQYFKLVIAPTGCTVPVGADGSQYISPGIGFEFDGAILGTPIQVVLSAGLKDGLVLKGKLTVPAVDLYALKLQGTKPGIGAMIDLDIDTRASRYRVAFDGGVAIGVPEKGIGGLVVVSGELDLTNSDYVAFRLDGRASIKLGVVGLDVDPMHVNVKIAKPGKSPDLNYADVDVKLVVNALGFGLKAGGSLTYRNGQLEQLRVFIGVPLDIVVAAVNGTAEFNYCLGTLSDLTLDGSRCTVFAGTVGATPAYRVSFYGTFRVLWWTKQYLWRVYDQRGTEGSVPKPPEPELDPKYVPGSIPSLVPHTLSPYIIRAYKVYDFTWHSQFTDTYVKAAYPLAWNGTPACSTAALGTQWNPTASVPNPRAVAANPDPSGAACALIADILTDTSQPGSVTQRVPVVCSADSCVAKAGDFNGKVLALNGANGSQAREGRDKLLTGLRTPPVVQPAGTVMNNAPGLQVPNLPSPDGDYTMAMSSVGAWVFTQKGAIWYNEWSGAKNFMLGKTGLLTALDENGKVVATAGTKAPLDPDKYPVTLHVQDGFQVVQQQPSGPPKAVWGVTSTGKCFPDGANCQSGPLSISKKLKDKILIPMG